jgi:threonyl-tRNA synthetase
MVTLTFPNGDKNEYPEDMTGLELAGKISTSLAKEAIAIKINDKVFDMSAKIKHDAHIKILTAKDPEGLAVIRHSCSHLMAHAIKRLFPKAVPTIGPVIEDGFYYDFDNLTIKEEDLAKIEEMMHTISAESLAIKRIELTQAKALKQFPNPFKQELIKDLQDEKISAYEQGDFLDLCTGPHVPSTNFVKNFKLLKIAGSYWRGDAKNKMLTRIYGTAWASDKELKEYLHRLEEAEKRDHKKLGKELGIFMQSELVGKGLPLWLPNGTIIKDEIEQFAKEVERKAGYVRVSTPHLSKEELFKTSGHLPYYADSMYPPMILDDGKYYLKAMNCPIHHLIYMHESRSYRDLPLRIAEYGTCYRNELSGTLSGLLRVRMLSMNDAHIYCTKDQIAQEIKSVIEMIIAYFKTFGLTEYSFRLSLHDPAHNEKYIDEPSNWTFAEEEIRKTLKELKVQFVEAKDEAAFYGPKVDIQYKAVSGREESMSTVQLDFAAKKRFGLSYADKDGTVNNEVYVIHRAPLSTHERFIAYLIEHYAGAFPFWLSPVQVILMTLTDEHKAYAEELRKKLFDEGIRVEVDDRVETIGKKVREAQVKKIPFMITLGGKEAEQKTVAVRTRDGQVKFGVPADEFVKKCHELKTNRSLQTSI